MKKYDYVAVGAGYAGSVFARAAADAGSRTLILEKRAHPGGNAYDAEDECGVLCHCYGPHIFHTKDREVYEFLSRFTEWNGYRHEVVAAVGGVELPVPFNLNSLDLAFGDRAPAIAGALIRRYGEGARVPIIGLRESGDPALTEVADYVYENVFLRYTEKQWGMKPEEIDPATTARVPVVLSRDNGYFDDPYQGLPTDGYTAMFERMLDHPLIDVELNAEALDRLELTDGGGILLDGEPFGGRVIWTGELDRLFAGRLGALPYRTLDFEFEDLPVDRYQSHGTVNYTVSERFTRITEFKHMTGQRIPGVTAIVREYPRGAEPGDTPYYPIISPENAALYARYAELAARWPRLHPLGRLAEYKYYNMDAIAARALALAKQLAAGR